MNNVELSATLTPLKSGSFHDKVIIPEDDWVVPKFAADISDNPKPTN